MVNNIITVDVEDWFHILDLRDEISIKDYSNLESRVERNTYTLLNILDEYKVKGTFFILGWVAQHFPHLIQEICNRGHEVASHSYAHKLCYKMNPEEFKEDTVKSIQVVEDIIGQKVLGYRAPGFSIKQESLWTLDILVELGIKYDSSIFPSRRGHGGLPGAPIFPYYQTTLKGKEIFEFPISCIKLFNLNIAFSGGGYLRLFPYRFIKWGIHKYNKLGYPVVIYIHPREIDPYHPRLKMPLYRRFKSYVNLSSTEKKLRLLLQNFSFKPMKQVFERYKKQVAGGKK